MVSSNSQYNKAPWAIEKINPSVKDSLNNLAEVAISENSIIEELEKPVMANKMFEGWYLDENFETNIKGLYSIGDGGGMTRGLMMASASGVQTARNLCEK